VSRARPPQICAYLFDPDRYLERLGALLALDCVEALDVSRRRARSGRSRLCTRASCAQVLALAFDQHELDDWNTDSARRSEAAAALSRVMPSREHTLHALDVAFHRTSETRGFSTAHWTHFARVVARLHLAGKVRDDSTTPRCCARAALTVGAARRQVNVSMDSLGRVMVLLARGGETVPVGDDTSADGADRASREETQILLKQLVQACGGEAEPLWPALIQECRLTRLWSTLTMLYRRTGQLAHALECCLADEAARGGAAEFIVDALQDASLEPAAKAELLAAAMNSLPTLFEANKLGTVRLLLTAFADQHERLMAELDATPELQFLYLQGVLHQTQKNELHPSNTLSKQLAQAGLVREKMHEHYVGLLCRFAPHAVFEYLQAYDTYRVDICLELCEQHGVRDATAYLKERTGDLGGALQVPSPLTSPPPRDRR